MKRYEDDGEHGAGCRWYHWCAAWLIFAMIDTRARLDALWWKFRKRLTWRVECAWCRRTVQYPLLPLGRIKVSHTICQRCFDSQTFARGDSLESNANRTAPACRGANIEDPARRNNLSLASPLETGASVAAVPRAGLRGTQRTRKGAGADGATGNTALNSRSARLSHKPTPL